MEIVVDQPERMNLLGLFLKAALESRAGALERVGARGDVAVSAGAMSVTLSFSPERVVVRKGIAAGVQAHVRGPLEAIVAIGRGHAARALLSRRARISGNPLAALPLARVFGS